MNVNIEMDKEDCKMAISGEMTIYFANEIYRSISSSLVNSKSIEVDLSEVEEIDSSGLQLLVVMKKYMLDNNLKLSLINHSVAVLDLLNLSNLVNYFGDPIVMNS